MHAKWIIGLSLLEPVPIRPDLDERSRMGGWWLPGCGTSQEGRRTTQWGWWLQNVYSLLIRLTSPMISISLGFLTVKNILLNFSCCIFYLSTEKVSPEGGPCEIHTSGRHSFHHTCQEEPGTTEWRKIGSIRLNIYLLSGHLTGVLSEIGWCFLILSWRTRQALSRQCTSTLWVKMSLSSSKPKLMQSFSVGYELNHMNLYLCCTNNLHKN